MMIKPGWLLSVSVLLSGCQPIEYYSQAVAGQTSLWLHQRDIEVVLSDPAVPPEIKARLRVARQAREFASRVLKLPENNSYSRYVDLDRDYVVWNVVATPRYSLDAIESCFPVVGCMSYRGYYRKEMALSQAGQHQQAGLDVYVGGVSAYSTLGWFDDPLLSSMLGRSDSAIAGLVFHELAHQRVYIKDDTQFNESFATAVERLGLSQWAATQEIDKELEAYFLDRARRDDVVRLVLESRVQIAEAYRANEATDEQKLAAIKREQFAELKSRYAGLVQNGGGTPGFDRFFAGELNNASLALFGEYHGWVGAFEHLFDDSDGDWEIFYAAVESLSKKPEAERSQVLQRLLQGV